MICSEKDPVYPFTMQLRRYTITGTITLYQDERNLKKHDLIQRFTGIKTYPKSKPGPNEYLLPPLLY